MCFRGDVAARRVWQQVGVLLPARELARDAVNLQRGQTEPVTACEIRRGNAFC
jgi:hypothetical protein